jgi:hypothetical protein
MRGPVAASAAYLCRAGLLLPARCFVVVLVTRLKAASTAAGVKVERPNRTYDLDAGKAAPSCPLPEERVSGQPIGSPFVRRRRGSGRCGRRGAQAYLGARSVLRSTRWWMGCDPWRCAPLMPSMGGSVPPSASAEALVAGTRARVRDEVAFIVASALRPAERWPLLSIGRAEALADRARERLLTTRQLSSPVAGAVAARTEELVALG